MHRDLARIDPAPFGYIQCYPFAARLREGWVGPIPGTYALLAGRLPVEEATAEGLRASARTQLSALDTFPAHLRDNLLEHGAGRLERHVRLLCTQVWPTLYNVLTLRQDDPIATWNLTKMEAMAALPEISALAQTIRRFYEAVLAYYPTRSSVDAALGILETGVAFLRAVQAWSKGNSITQSL